MEFHASGMLISTCNNILLCSEPNETEYKGNELPSDDDAAPTSMSKRRKVGVGRPPRNKLQKDLSGQRMLSRPGLGALDACKFCELPTKEHTFASYRSPTRRQL